ncbi:MAG: ATP-binding cassette domain-containing protein [candidate division Zixibacteria bacterium]|nr:ATP-binding cassette domain-containing protein [candidate division Zixibacteria bacterium]
MVKVESLCKVFRDKKRGDIFAVNNLSFECKPGMILGILGLNGAGKTTTLRILATLLKPTSGNAYINNIDILRDPDRAKAQIGFISGDTGLYRRLTPREIIRYFGELYSIPREESDKRLLQMSEILNMKEFLDTQIDKLSTGQKQKVSIVRTILHRPSVLIMDEPTSGLDIISSANIIELIRRSKSENSSVLFSTHMMYEAQKLCDEIIIIHKGMVVKHGTINNLREHFGIDDLDQIFINSIKSVE